MKKRYETLIYFEGTLHQWHESMPVYQAELARKQFFFKCFAYSFAENICMHLNNVRYVVRKL